MDRRQRKEEVKLDLLSYPVSTIQNEITTNIDSKPNDTRKTISMDGIFFNK
jgi:hypothetical protein